MTMRPRNYSEYLDDVNLSICRTVEKFPTKEYPLLYSPIEYALKGGGKRLRPVLAMMAYEALGGQSKKVIDLAIGIEIFHNFTLLHDDVMDKSPMRRGRATVHEKWDVATAILSGDAMLTLATDLISSADKDNKLIVEFNHCAMAVYEGQALDMEFESRDDVTVGEYVKMIGLKTGALLGGAMKLGALAAGADDKVAGYLYDFGYKLGLAFQIWDDYLDVYGDSDKFGKPIGGDIDNNKKTWLLLEALNSDKEANVNLRKAMMLCRGKEKREKVTEIFNSLKMKERVGIEVAKYCNEAEASLMEAGLNENWNNAFIMILKNLIGREK